MPASTAASTTAFVAASSIRPPKLLQPSPTIETSRLPSWRVSMPDILLRPGAQHDLRLGHLGHEPVVVGAAHLGLDDDGGRAHVQRPAGGDDAAGPHGTEEVGLRLDGRG